MQNNILNFDDPSQRTRVKGQTYAIDKCKMHGSAPPVFPPELCLNLVHRLYGNSKPHTMENIK